MYIKPRSPRLNGKVERSHRIDEEEFYRMMEGIVIDDTKMFNKANSVTDVRQLYNMYRNLDIRRHTFYVYGLARVFFYVNMGL